MFLSSSVAGGDLGLCHPSRASVLLHLSPGPRSAEPRGQVRQEGRKGRQSLRPTEGELDEEADPGSWAGGPPALLILGGLLYFHQMRFLIA